MPCGEACGQDSVHFLGKWGSQISSAQSGFDVSDRDVFVESGEGPAEGRGCVTLNQHGVWLQPGEDGRQPLDGSRCQCGKRLPGLHQIKVDVRGDIEELKNLIEHLTMLSRHHNLRLEPISLFERLDQRRHFDGFRASPEDEHDLFHGLFSVVQRANDS